MADDHGAPIAYTVLQEGTPVLARDGHEVGTVKRVLADEAADIFDGLSVQTGDGERFVDAPEVEALYERAVVLTISADQARGLPEHSPGPAVIDATADDLAGGSSGEKAKSAARRVWDRLSGNY